jgi:hypothetical protein
MPDIWGNSFVINSELSMSFSSQNDYDDYAFLILVFTCDDCHETILPPAGYDDDMGEEYQYYVARRAESAGWYISLGDNFPCLCPECRQRRGL